MKRERERHREIDRQTDRVFWQQFLQILVVFVHDIELGRQREKEEERGR